jgi:hypothetical protein
LAWTWEVAAPAGADAGCGATGTLTGQVVATNPAHAVRGPKHVVKTGKTTMLDAEEARTAH